MAISIRAIQLSIAVVNIVIFALVFTSIWPFPNGDFKIDLPDSDDVEWSYSSGTVYVSAPFSIENGGFYDVEDLVITYEVTNYTESRIHSAEIVIGTIPAGEVTVGTIDFTLPLLELYSEGITWMVFNDDYLHFVVDVSCAYTARLVNFYAEYSVSIPWDALIREVQADEVYLDGTELHIDYHLTTSDLLDGLSTTLRAYLYDGSTMIAQETQTIQLGGTHRGTLTFDLLSLSAIPDRIVLTAEIGGFSITESFALDPGWLP
jgi:hypothetical protein